MIPKTRLVLINPISYNDHIAKVKIPNSSTSRIIPEVTIGALPERLGSSGTANAPQITASSTGIPKARINFSHPSLCFQPQMPTDARAHSSSIKRIPRLIGCDPMIVNKCFTIMINNLFFLDIIHRSLNPISSTGHDPTGISTSFAYHINVFKSSN